MMNYLDILFKFFTVVTLLAAIYFWMRVFRFRARATGRISHVVWESHSEEHRRSPYPVIVFSVGDNEVTFHSRISFRGDSGGIGKEVVVAYDPEEPNNAEIAYRMYLVPIGVMPTMVLLAAIPFRKLIQDYLPVGVSMDVICSC